MAYYSDPITLMVRGGRVGYLEGRKFVPLGDGTRLIADDSVRYEYTVRGNGLVETDTGEAREVLRDERVFIVLHTRS